MSAKSSASSPPSSIPSGEAESSYEEQIQEAERWYGQNETSLQPVSLPLALRYCGVPRRVIMDYLHSKSTRAQCHQAEKRTTPTKLERESQAYNSEDSSYKEQIQEAERWYGQNETSLHPVPLEAALRYCGVPRNIATDYLEVRPRTPERRRQAYNQAEASYEERMEEAYRWYEKDRASSQPVFNELAAKYYDGKTAKVRGLQCHQCRPCRPCRQCRQAEQKIAPRKPAKRCYWRQAYNRIKGVLKLREKP